MISAVVLLKPHHKLSQKTKQSLSFCDEIVTHTDGKTFSDKRNNAMRVAKGGWILFIDNDEIVGEKLVMSIKGVIGNTNGEVAYYIKRRDFWWGRELKWGEVLAARTNGFIRLVKKDSGTWQGDVHERFVPNGSSGCLEGFINHYPHKTLSEFIADINEYSSIRADELFQNKIKTNIFQIIFFPAGKFIYTYFLRFGFLDGAAGFAYSFLMSFHSFLVRSKLYIKYA